MLTRYRGTLQKSFGSIRGCVGGEEEDQHQGGIGDESGEIRVENRKAWQDERGVPVAHDSEIKLGRLRIDCVGGVEEEVAVTNRGRARPHRAECRDTSHHCVVVPEGRGGGGERGVARGVKRKGCESPLRRRTWRRGWVAWCGECRGV